MRSRFWFAANSTCIVALALFAYFQLEHGNFGWVVWNLLVIGINFYSVANNISYRERGPEIERRAV